MLNLRKHEVTGCRRKGRLRKAWSRVVTNDLRVTGLMADVTRNWSVWSKRAVKNHTTIHLPTSDQTT